MHFLVLLTIALFTLSKIAIFDVNVKSSTIVKKCELPLGCRFETLNLIDFTYEDNYFYTNKYKGVRCTVDSKHYRFDFDSWQVKNVTDACDQVNFKSCFEIKFRKSSLRLDKEFNLEGLVEFILLYDSVVYLQIANVRNFGVDLISNEATYSQAVYLNVFGSRLEFYVGSRRLESCTQLLTTNVTSPRTIFNLFRNSKEKGNIYLANCEFPRAMCPLFFRDSNIFELSLFGMTDSFYKTNVLSFTNESIVVGMNSSIDSVAIFKTDNLKLDMSLLNPHVFQRLQQVFLFDIVSFIDPHLFELLPDLGFMKMQGLNLRRLTHRQGIEWIRAINAGLQVNLTDVEHIDRVFSRIVFEIELRVSSLSTCSTMFADADFCAYVRFPFDQLVVLFVVIDPGTLAQWLDARSCCTFRWLVRYFSFIKHHYSTLINGFNLFNSTHVECDFERLKMACNSSQFERRAAHRGGLVWDYTVWKNTNKIFQIAFYVLSFPIALMGLVTNSVVVRVILNKKNVDIFKQFVQYHYLCAISVFNMVILSIHVLSWLSECNDSFELLCPETRKLIWVQFFKIIFKEAVVVALRFMSNFAYVAFSFNRISLIGQGQNRVVRFFATSSILKYMLVAAFVSCALSVVKLFRFQVNYDHAERGYPINFEENVWLQSSRIKDVYFVINSVCDILNYVVFVLVNLGIDLYMLVRLKRTLDEKMKKPAAVYEVLARIVFFQDESSSQMANAAKKRDSEDPMSNAVKMVVINSALNILFKLPLAFIPIHNAIGTFYFKSSSYFSGRLGFYSYNWKLVKTGFFYLIPDLAEFFYILLISIQLFIYIRFDKKINLAYSRLFRRSTSSNIQAVR